MEASKKAKEKVNLPTEKIAIKEAINIYFRGMKHLYKLEEKRIASAAKRKIDYRSYLIPTASVC